MQPAVREGSWDLRRAARGPDLSRSGKTRSRRNPINQRPWDLGENGEPRQSQTDSPSPCP